MTRIDWIVLKRIGSRVLLVVSVIFGLITLVESLDTWRFSYLSSVGGPQLAILAIVTAAARWTIRTLSVTVLIGAIVGLLDLQARRELTVIKASGMSVWRVLRAPIITFAIASFLIALFLDGMNTEINRTLNPSHPGSGALTESGELWLEQTGGDERYVLMAKHAQPGGTVLDEVTVFFVNLNNGTRITAPKAELTAGAWRFEHGMRFYADASPQPLAEFSLPTTTTAADMALRLASTEDLTFFELARALSTELTEPTLRAAVATRFMRLLTLPLTLVGSLFIAFAFTAGYRRTNKYGAAVLYGIVLGFVVFVIIEMADRAGSSGALDPLFAAAGPAFVAIVIGLTVLLHKEDGRA